MGVVKLLLLLYIIAIFLVVISSWLRLVPGGPAEQGFLFLRRITDPVLEPVRRLVPPIGGVVDLSPTIVLFVLYAVYSLI